MLPPPPSSSWPDTPYAVAVGPTPISRDIPINSVGNNFDIGSFLLFALEPGSTIYLDTQFLYSWKTYLRYRKLLPDPRGLRAELEQQDVDCVLLKHFSP